MGHLGPSYGMDFDRDYSSYNLGNLGGGNSAGMNDISALAAAASDQLYELERHEAFRRAEFEMRHRQIASARKSNGNSPSATPNGNGNGNGNGSTPYGMSSERERFSLHGVATPEGGRVVYPVSAAQPSSGNQPAVPSGTLADPTYLVPPTCCHEECHKSYRKRLKYAKQTQACPNCLSQTHGHGHGSGNHGLGGQGGGGGGSGHHSSGSNTPKDRSKANSSDDLTKLGGGGGGGGGGMGGASAYNLHQASLHSQLAKLQQQHLAALQQARSRRSSQQQQQQTQMGHASANVNRHGNGLGQAFGGMTHGHGHGYGGSAAVSANPSPASSDSEDDDEPMPHPHFEMHEVSHPVMHGMNKMSLFHHRTAPTSAVTSPIHSRNPSRAGSPVEGHSANSGKHGHASHTARDAKHRSHPYTHGLSSGHGSTHGSSTHLNALTQAHFSMPNSPHTNPISSKSNRYSPPDLARSLSGGAGPRQSVEDILNSSAIPPPPSHSDRMLPPPNSNSSFNSSAPSLGYSLSSNPGSALNSPSGSRASSPTPHLHGHPHGHGHHGHSHSSHHSSNLAHSVRNAFGMTPISASAASSPSGSYKAGPGMSPPTQHKLAPLGHGGHGLTIGNIGVGSMSMHPHQHQQSHQSQMGGERMGSVSQSRGNSPVHGHGHGGMKMEVDGQA